MKNAVLVIVVWTSPSFVFFCAILLNYVLVIGFGSMRCCEAMK